MNASKIKFMAAAVEWIALNDEPTWWDVNQVKDMISVALVADVFGFTCEHVAKQVIACRQRRYATEEAGR